MADPRLNLPSASALSRLIKCQGSQQLIESIKSKSGSGLFININKEADFGDDVHAVLSKEVEEMTVSERVAYVARKCESIREKLRREIFGDVQPSIYVETRFWIRDKAQNQIFSAQLDWVGIHGDKALICDYKSLPGQHESASENYQLLAQAVALVDDDETRNATGEKPVYDVYVAIIQPSITLKPEVCLYRHEDLYRAKMLIVKAIDASRAIGAPRTPGAHCKYCPASRRCPENATELMALEKRNTFDIATLTPEMVAQVLPVLPSLKKRIADLEKHAKHLAEEGQLPGYKMEERQGNRYVQSLESVNKVRDALADWLGKDDIRQLVELPLGELRERFITQYVAKERCDKVEAGKMFDELIDPICQRNAPSKRLVKS